MTEAGAGKRGRPPVEYSEKYHPAWARSLSRRGLTHEEIAREMGISNGLFYRWRKQYPDFVEALKETKSEADSRVEASLYQRAMGYDYEESKIIAGVDSSGKTVTRRVEKVKKHVPPDVTAQIFWLKNRMPKEWRDVRKVEHDGRLEVSTLADLIAGAGGEADEESGDGGPESAS